MPRSVRRPSGRAVTRRQAVSAAGRHISDGIVALVDDEGVGECTANSPSNSQRGPPVMPTPRERDAVRGGELSKARSRPGRAVTTARDADSENSHRCGGRLPVGEATSKPTPPAMAALGERDRQPAARAVVRRGQQVGARPTRRAAGAGAPRPRGRGPAARRSPVPSTASAYSLPAQLGQGRTRAGRSTRPSAGNAGAHAAAGSRRGARASR